MPQEEDDPVVASYNVYIASAAGSQQSEGSTHDHSKYYVLQYPSHRPSSKPYNSPRAQKPSAFRIKPNAGIFEIDIPIRTPDNYNTQLGSQFGRAMHESKLAHPTTGHGLSGGFAQHASTSAPAPTIHDVPEHGLSDTALRIQTLGGKLAVPTDRDPVYMLATLNPGSKQIHLRHLDAVIQMRPQLHHIDASDEAKKRSELASKPKPAPETTADGPVKLETRAIEMKLKDSTKEDPKDRNLNANAKLLREIQNDPWQRYTWIEKGGVEFESAGISTSGDASDVKLATALDNDEWLNRMSSPGIELRTRLKGRDRERARRKRQERLRNARATERSGAAEEDEDVSGTASSDSDEVDEDNNEADIGPVNVSASGQPPVQIRPESPEVQIKQEGPGGGNVSAAAALTTAPRRRGRPPKNVANAGS